MDALDRALTTALAVDPSPEFVARVRARIAEEPAPSFWRLPRLMLTAGALAVVVVAAVSVSRFNRADDLLNRAGPSDVVQAFRPAVLVAPTVESRTDGIASIRRHRVRREPNLIQLVSIEDLPTAPIGDVVPQMTADLVTMSGVHP